MSPANITIAMFNRLWHRWLKLQKPNVSPKQRLLPFAMAMHAVVGYQITEEMVRLYCKKKNIGRFHDIGVLLSGRKRPLQAMLDSPRDNENHVLDISSQEDETSAKTSDPQEDVRGMHKSS